MTAPDVRRIDLLGLPVHALDLEGLLRAVDTMVTSGGRFTIGYLNVHTVNQALEFPDVAEFMRQADVVYCDGNGVRFGARILGERLPTRMTGADWIWDFARHAADRGYRLTWTGARPGIAEEACGRLVASAPSLQVVGTHHGYFDKEGPESDEVIEAINTAAPHIAIVGFGTPVQERWIAANRHEIEAPVVWAVGATADFVAGAVDRGPELLHQHGMEWLARLLVDPRRLWQRYLIGNTQYLARVAAARGRKWGMGEGSRP